MQDWELETEEYFAENTKIPIFNFQLNRAGRGIFKEVQDEQIPSDDEPIPDFSILEFPKLEYSKDTDSTILYTETVLLYSYTLHLLVFRGDLNAIHDLWQNSYDEFSDYINVIDLRGNTPLMLSVKLASTGKIYEKIFRFLLCHCGDPHIKDPNGWSVLDEAVCQKNKPITLAIFDHLHKEKTKKWLKNKHIVLAALKSLPDFYIEMKWEFDSSIIPLVSRIAPHDTCKFWKHGTAFRIDTTLVGWKNLRSKRRNISLFFKPIENRNIDKEIFLVNHSKQTIVHPFEALDPEEKSAVVNDIITTEPMQGDVKLLSYTVKDCLSWRNKPISQKIGPWTTEKKKIKYRGQVGYKKKIVCIDDCCETEYFNTEIFDPVTAKYSYSNSNERTRSLIKNSKAFVWLSEEFPFSLQQFLPVLQLIGESNRSIGKLHKFLSSESLLNSIPSNSFPVKLDIPLTMSVKAVVTFEKFQKINDGSALEIPDYRFQSRKIAQKILTCPKKRVLLANLVI